MAEYISREAVLKAFKLIAKNPNKDYQRGMQDAIDCLVPEVIADIPAADVQPVTVGRWKKDTMGYDVYIECSECGTSLSMSNYIEEEWRELMRYCPCCGARMNGEQDD